MSKKSHSIVCPKNVKKKKKKKSQSIVCPKNVKKKSIKKRSKYSMS